ncbi:MAG: aldehyde dehydrogenase family protein, partial [Ignavibacteria bacterium]
MKPFKNEPFTDFTSKKNAVAFREALEKVHGELNKEYPLIIGGEKIFTEDKISSLNPSNTSETVGRVSKASPEMANRAIETANLKFEEWKTVPAKKRADYLF